MPLELVHYWPVFSSGLPMERKGDSEKDKKDGLRVQSRGQDLVVGFLPGLIVFILKIIPNSWAGDQPAHVPGMAQG